ncbi:MAG: TetR/AcrR family transcriptional regulator [Solirubrobacterales bacterium]
MAVLSRRGAQASAARRAGAESRLLSATEVLLAEGGAYADLTIEQIASRAGLSRSAFYESFPDKRELLKRLAQGAAEPLIAATDALARFGRDDGEGVRPLMTGALSLARDNAAVFRAVFEASTYDEEIAAFWLEIGGRFADPLAAQIRDGQGAGALPVDPRAGAAVLVGAVVQALYHQVSGDTDLSDDQLVDALTALWERALFGSSTLDRTGQS